MPRQKQKIEMYMTIVVTIVKMYATSSLVGDEVMFSIVKTSKCTSLESARFSSSLFAFDASPAIFAGSSYIRRL